MVKFSLRTSLTTTKPTESETFKYLAIFSESMTEIAVKVDVPSEFKERFELALAKLMSSLVKEIEFSVANEIVSKSKFTERDADKLANKVKSSMHSQLKSEGLI